MSVAAEARQKKPKRNKWFWIKRLTTIAFFILIPTLLYFQARNIDWQEVAATLRTYPPGILIIGAGIALVSYFVYCAFDLLGRYYTRHGLPVKQVVPVAFVCYAFNLNMGALVGGVAFRYRLYSRLGLDVPTITRVLTLSMITNWLGYIILAGGIFALGLITLPESWEIGGTGLRILGVGLWIVAAAYLLACGLSKRRSWHWRGHEILLPPLRMALVQAGLGALNWSLMALLIYLMMPEDAFYPTILGILMISSIAGVITHIPAGLGVIEVVFITALQHQFAKSELLAALIAYRALYFILPLVIACIIYMVLENRSKTLRNQQ
ncbi:lysylphosphatidylglycerol synthase domain-containing protein [Halopseudomonas salina]|uniref:Membrane protein n=1 Tax=Halopseudomonas salina TaxID=1323744 RepID=A0ABQ1P0P9_9GAMM|nr:lysylphosphatidylglycerol synthase domain-containing protein [Halopseudomonas salina]GGC86754.1 membrane protein [Halopseudomonas salina]